MPELSKVDQLLIDKYVLSTFKNTRIGSKINVDNGPLIDNPALSIDFSSDKYYSIDNDQRALKIAKARRLAIEDIKKIPKGWRISTDQGYKREGNALRIDILPEDSLDFTDAVLHLQSQNETNGMYYDEFIPSTIKSGSIIYATAGGDSIELVAFLYDSERKYLSSKTIKKVTSLYHDGYVINHFNLLDFSEQCSFFRIAIKFAGSDIRIAQISLK